jgi:primosomal protein N' (replication factor Y)
VVCYLSVALPLPVHKLFTYRYEFDGQDARTLAGCRALVPFGKRMLTGVITGLSTEPGGPGIKAITELLDEKPVFTQPLLQFTRWVAEYYLCSWGEVLKAALPQGMTPQSVMNVRLLHMPPPAEMEKMRSRAPKRAALLQALHQHNGPLTVVYLERLLQSATVADQLDALERSGLIECIRFVEQDARPRMQKMVSIPDILMSDKDILRTALDTLDKSAPRQAQLLSHIYLQMLQQNQPLPLAAMLQETKTTSAVADGLIRKNLLICSEEPAPIVEQETDFSLARTNEAHLPLTTEQEHALRKIAAAMEPDSQHKNRTFLLHGITGSGKTLVYIHAIRMALAQGKNSVLLVPEISLTPQLTDRFRAAFGNEIAILHSRMNNAERFAHWRKIQRGEARIVIGARSAIFAPFPAGSLALIIVDEEHEASYKQESPAPRYNARDCAVVRGNIEGAVVVLGSATPSMESMYNAVNGKYHLLEIHGRADGASLPRLRSIHSAQERRKGMMQGSFSNELLFAIADRVLRREGIILFHNRRGFARFQECADCSTVPMCKNCSVALTLHKNAGMLRCHYCGYATQAIHICSVCGSTELLEIGAGTQKIEEELEKLLLDKGIKASIQRMDLDTTAGKGAHRRILQDFHQGKTDILVGTQMVAKGLDFERVTLVGVIDADQQLFMPDFRASERTFQLLTQVAGRAGRGRDLPGEFILQTSHPEHQAILAALSGHYDHFYADEIQTRRESGYPPFTRFIRIEFSGLDEQKVHQHAHWFAGLLPAHEQAFQRVGPAVPTIARLRAQYRRLIILKGHKMSDPTGEKVRSVLRHALQVYQQKYASSSVKMYIDIDSFTAL